MPATFSSCYIQNPYASRLCDRGQKLPHNKTQACDFPLGAPVLTSCGVKYHPADDQLLAEYDCDRRCHQPETPVHHSRRTQGLQVPKPPKEVMVPSQRSREGCRGPGRVSKKLRPRRIQRAGPGYEKISTGDTARPVQHKSPNQPRF